MWALRRTARQTEPRHSCRILPVLDLAQKHPPLVDDYDAFKAERGASPARVVVLSVPKAGTYLMAKILENLRLIDLEVHLWESGLSDYRMRSREEKLAQARVLTRDIPIEVAARMVLPGQFVVGHIPCTEAVRQQFSSFLRIVCVRDLRHAVVSFMRFERRRLVADPLRSLESRAWAGLPDGPAATAAFLASDGGWVLDAVRGVAGWIDDPAALVCRFEDLIGLNGGARQRQSAESVATALGIKAGAGAKALQAALGAETLTRSKGPTTLDGFWDSAVEAAFQAAGGPQVNEMLGYPAAGPRWLVR